MTKAFWQAKLWGLLHQSVNWQSLACMEGWTDPDNASSHPTSTLDSEWLAHVSLCDSIAQASDRAALKNLPLTAFITTAEKQSIYHLLSGAHRTLNLAPLANPPQDLIPDWIKSSIDLQQVYWWFWRCYPALLAERCPDSPLKPADLRIPDASVWSYTSMTSALAGALAGYYAPSKENPEPVLKPSHPHIAVFSFTPIQELIKASRKLRDFWAGSWLLHYLSAKVSWEIAKKYGPDTLLYPCLYNQPLIDHWLLKKYPEFKDWIADPTQESESLDLLLTAGFPNVLVMVLPNNGVKTPPSQSGASEVNPVRSVMAFAEQILQENWQEIGKKVLDMLKERHSNWRNISLKTWDGWLSTQWQNYWAALPLGDLTRPLHTSSLAVSDWTADQNKFAELKNTPGTTDSRHSSQELFIEAEQNLLNVLSTNNPSNIVNIGSWWAPLFDRVRGNLSSIKTARHWRLPTAFGPRSTISGIGPVVTWQNPQKQDWSKEGDTKKFWDNNYGLFDGREQLNATEVVKRGLYQICLSLLDIPAQNGKIPALYPDLCSGAAGWLRTLQAQAAHGNEAAEAAQAAIAHYQNACQTITSKFDRIKDANAPWGIPWVDRYEEKGWLHPRLLNSGWLLEDLKDQSEIDQNSQALKSTISRFFAPGNNPTDWYVMAAGDGDGMSDWLRGLHLESYKDYTSPELLNHIDDPELRKPVEQFLAVRKRMGPGTHSALSRALLDFSNQLVPYLTEQRYAGRLIYGGGDDVLAYTNLWEWDNWLWDIRECFRGQEDPGKEFAHDGDYWQWNKSDPRPLNLAERPLFTMGQKATISFGLVIANQGVPLAIALENLWKAEEEAKEQVYLDCDGRRKAKDAVQVRVLYGNGNILKATAKFDTFNKWRSLLEFPTRYPQVGFDPALFEQASEQLKQHPIPIDEAIKPWVNAFCGRRELFKGNEEAQQTFVRELSDWLKTMWKTTSNEKADFETTRDHEIQTWLKLAAFVLRKRNIVVG